MLNLDIAGFTSTASWTWRLTDDDGSLLAGQDVRLDPTSTDFSLLTDLYGNRWRLDEGPVRQRRSQTRQIEQVGNYTAAEVLGPAVSVIAARAPLTVRVNLPSTAVALLAMPLELARYQDETLAARGVVFCYRPCRQEGPSSSLANRPDRNDERGGPLRALAVFALPQTSSALGLVRERRALEDLLLKGHIVGGEPAARLEILQYGATRVSLAKALADPVGWDMIHLAGHGGPGLLYLENESGGSEPVSADELIRLLSPGRGRVKLVVLSACESGVARACRIFGVRPTLSADRAPVMLPALGYEIASALDCSVVAMRYPVDDRFSAEFVRFYYQAVLAHGLPVGDAMRAARIAAHRAVPAAPLSAATPILLADEPDWRLIRPPVPPSGHSPTSSGVPAVSAARRRAPWQPSTADLFIGRTSLLTQLGATLGPSAKRCGIVLVGMPGVGKSAACAEAAARYAASFDHVVWYRATRRTTAQALAAAIAAGYRHRRGESATSRDYHAAAERERLIRQVRASATLVIIDAAQALLAEDGAWADAQAAELITALLQPGARSRVVLVADRPLPELADLTATLVVPMLSRSESEWLARELTEVRSSDQDGSKFARMTWLVDRGHPELIDYSITADEALTERRLRRLYQIWEVFGPLSPATTRAQRPLGRDHPGSTLRAWALSRAGVVSSAARRALILLSVLEQPDRSEHWTEFVWDALAEISGQDAGPFSAAVTELVTAALAEDNGDGLYLVHPAVASVGRGLDSAATDLTATAMTVGWRHEYQGALTDGGDQKLAAHCAASTVPYLMRLNRWEEASAACELAINHDSSPAMAARLGTHAVEIVRASAGTPLEAKARFVHAVLSSHMLHSKGIEHFTHLLAWAEKTGALDLIIHAAHSLAVSLVRTDPIQANRILQIAMEANSGEPFGPWLQILLTSTRADILFQLGSSQEALESADQALTQLAQLERTGVAPRGVNPVSMRYTTLLTAAQAAKRLGRRALVATYDRQLAQLLTTAGDHSLAQAQFNEVHQLIASGELETAAHLLRAALAAFTGLSSARERGLVLINLAEVEHRLRHPREAADLGRQALRASYAAGETLDAAAAHSRIANALAAGTPGQAEEAPVHILAAAVIHLRVNGMLLAAGVQPEPLTAALTRLAMCQARKPGLIPASFPDLASRLADSTGIDIARLIAGLERVPVTAGPKPGSLQFSFNDATDQAGDSVTDALCWVRQVAPPAWVFDPESWQPVVGAAVAAAAARPDERYAFYQVVDDLRGTGWGALSAALTRLVDDPAGFVWPNNLQPVERAVLARTADALTRPARD